MVCNLISPKKERQKEREGTALINVLKSKHQTDIILVIRMTKRTSHTHNVLVTQDTRIDGVKVKVKLKVIHW